MDSKIAITMPQGDKTNSVLANVRPVIKSAAPVSVISASDTAVSASDKLSLSQDGKGRSVSTISREALQKLANEQDVGDVALQGEDELDKQIAKLQDEIAKLQEEIAQLRGKDDEASKQKLTRLEDQVAALFSQLMQLVTQKLETANQ